MLAGQLRKRYTHGVIIPTHRVLFIVPYHFTCLSIHAIMDKDKKVERKRKKIQNKK